MPAPSIPAEKRRVGLWARVDPQTKEYLESIPGENMGRKLDVLVNAALMGLVLKLKNKKA